jgi:hypothetical protein
MRAETASQEVDRGRRAAAESWLLATAPQRATAAMEWTTGGVAVLTAGVRWDAVRVPFKLLDPAFDGGTAPNVLRSRLEELHLVGPVFCDPYRPHLYFLVPPGTDRDWPADFTPVGVQCLGGTQPYIRHVGVPRLDQIATPGPYWLYPLDLGDRWHVDARHLYTVLRALVNDVTGPGDAITRRVTS